MTDPETIYLALGSNLEDRLANLQAALAALPPAVTVLRLSPVYETPPWGIIDQPAFLNMAIQADTRLAPPALLSFLKRLEKDLGRIPSVRYGPRLIDLDILFYGERILSIPGLVIPHPHLHERAFVLVPLADIAADFVHPILRQPIRDLLAGVDATGVKRYGELDG